MASDNTADTQVRAQVPDNDDVEHRSIIGGLLPWAAISTITLSAIYVRLMLGYWPRVYHDSPEFPFAAAAGIIAIIAAMSWPAMVCVALLLPIVRLEARARPAFNLWVLSCIIGTVALYLLVNFDPNGFLEWAFD